MIQLERKLEAVLFYVGEPQKKAHLARLLNVSLDDLDAASHVLSASLAERGIRLLSVNDELELVTAPETSDLIRAVRKDELVRELGKAGSLTLAIVLYRGPVSRAQIDHIRGVNSSFIVRNLMVRGLLERVTNPNNARQVLYQATPALLKDLGIATVEDLPDYEAIRDEVARFEAREDLEQEAAEAVRKSGDKPTNDAQVSDQGLRERPEVAPLKNEQQQL
jgi:segregation and condensation protein B